MTSPFRSAGFWPAIPLPLPAPTTEVTADPQNSICFNESWSPYVLGALKVLTRPESYYGTEDEIKFAVQESYDLLGRVPPYTKCPGECDINWRLGEAPDDGGYTSTIADFVLLETCDECSLIRGCFLFAFLNPIRGVADAKVKGIARVSGSPDAGGDFCYVHCYQTGAVVGNTFSFQWHDCLGTLHTQLEAGIEGDVAGGEMKDFQVTALDSFAMYMTIYGSYKCVAA